jgi:hypothetical protein
VSSAERRTFDASGEPPWAGTAWALWRDYWTAAEIGHALHVPAADVADVVLQRAAQQLGLLK